MNTNDNNNNSNNNNNNNVVALNNGWFGSCANLPPNPERKLSYSFGGEDFYRTPEPAVIVKTGSPIKIEDLQDCNDFSLGGYLLSY